MPVIYRPTSRGDTWPLVQNKDRFFTCRDSRYITPFDFLIIIIMLLEFLHVTWLHVNVFRGTGPFRGGSTRVIAEFSLKLRFSPGDFPHEGLVMAGISILNKKKKKHTFLQWGADKLPLSQEARSISSTLIAYALDHIATARHGLRNFHGLRLRMGYFHLWGLIKPRTWTAVITCQLGIAETHYMTSYWVR